MAWEARKDKISRLPDDILWHILSYLPMGVVVRTSIFSKRWRQIWTSVTSIDMSDTQGCRQHHCLTDSVNTVLRLNDMYYLRKFSLKCSCNIDIRTASELLQSILTTRIVEHLIISFYSYDLFRPVRLPPTLFTCNKLVNLKLSHGLFNLDLSPVHLPCIKILHIYSVLLVNDDTMKNLLEGCPVLEDLTMYCYCSNHLKTLFIRSSYLKRLSLTVNHVDRTAHLSIGIAIDAINVEHLNLSCIPDLTEACDIRSLSVSLIQVKLDIFFSQKFWTDREGCGNILVKFLRVVSNVKCMLLSSSTLECLTCAKLDELPMLHNLSYLELMVYTKSWHLLPFFLKCSPNLSTIVLEFDPFDDYKDEWHHQQCPEQGRWMLSLEKIIFEEFRGCENEMELVRYFLKNALNLKKMDIVFHISLPPTLLSDNEAIFNQVLMFPRSSIACQISAREILQCAREMKYQYT